MGLGAVASVAALILFECDGFQNWRNGFALLFLLWALVVLFLGLFRHVRR